MKTRKIKLPQLSFLSKYLEGDNEDFLESISSHVGHLVFEFNLLEERLTSFLCQLFIDDYDAIGLIVTKNMGFAEKVDLLDRFAQHKQSSLEKLINGHSKLIEDLKESGRLRNMVVHAEWNTVDLEGFAHTKLRIKSGELTQEFTQLNEDALIEIRNLIIETHNAFDDYEEDYFKI
ncbi:hypothetical protein G3O08_19825 [Cryomorpha ignava]|uniref:Uncharacterized protein n=1 Tax=Cryomorpha ignava TaxID=101383 RepID=A0A7K3WVS9_9FLAO|nr:hypothetical protein [Cryomorpha ignava]NEN25743.1 hypothetical protein [Cryomorpha ignava]